MYIFRVMKWEVFQQHFYHTLKYDCYPRKERKKKNTNAIIWVVNWATCFFHRIFSWKMNKLFILNMGLVLYQKLMKWAYTSSKQLENLLLVIQLQLCINQYELDIFCTHKDSSDEVSGNINESGILILHNENVPTFECLYNSQNKIFSRWPRHNSTKLHTTKIHSKFMTGQ